MSKVLEAIGKMSEDELVRVIKEVYRRQSVLEKPTKAKRPRKRK